MTEKLNFVLEVVKQWITNGGLGRLSDDEDGKGGEKLYWEGLMVKEGGARKVDRVTVGRFGGDLVPQA